MAVTIGLFIIGTVLGSFFNVVGLRLPKRQSVVRPPSACAACGQRLKARDLVPIWSWFANKGKCRMCGAKISALYPAGEAATGLGYALLPYMIETGPELYYAYVFFSYMVIVTTSDLKYRIIPNRLTYPMLLGTLLYRVFFHPLPVWDYALGFLLGGGMLIVAAMIGSWMGKPNAMGGGDVKLMALIGLAGGVQMIIVCLFISSLIGCITGLALIRSGRLTTGEIPFAPFIALGACISMAVHMRFFEWYLGIF